MGSSTTPGSATNLLRDLGQLGNLSYFILMIGIIILPPKSCPEWTRWMLGIGCVCPSWGPHPFPPVTSFSRSEPIDRQLSSQALLYQGPPATKKTSDAELTAAQAWGFEPRSVGYRNSCLMTCSQSSSGSSSSWTATTKQILHRSSLFSEHHGRLQSSEFGLVKTLH